MGRYLNPSKTKYEIDVNSEIYVDKSEMLLYTNSFVNTNKRYVCVSRPRRFGKTMAANMLSAYYCRTADSRNIFEDRKLAANSVKDGDKKGNNHLWDRYLGAFDVIQLVMTDFMTDKEKKLSVSEMIYLLRTRVMSEILREYPDVNYLDKENLIQSMDDIYQSEGRQFVLIIDEWDAVFRENGSSQDEQRLYLDFLRDLIKDREYIALCYMTGILPIKKYGHHSALNMFYEYTVIDAGVFAGCMGFTDEEVRSLCKAYDRDYEEIKNWYNGYIISGTKGVDGKAVADTAISIYNPLSVCRAVESGKCRNYWSSTETYNALSGPINRNEDGLKEIISMLIEGARYKVNIRQYQNDMSTFHTADDVLTMLIHLGYLGYDESTGEAFIPNREIREEFIDTTSNKAQWNKLFDILSKSEMLLEATWNRDSNLVAALVEEAHLKADAGTYNSEAALSYSIRLAYFNAEEYYTLIPEMQAGKGYADLIYIPSPEYADKPALLIELKYEKKAISAIEQIHRNMYPSALEKYKGNIILVGINYDKEIKSSEYKHHTCIIEDA